MDDSTFDDLIRKKLDNFEDPVYDGSSLAAFHQKLPVIGHAPWYFQTASRLFVVSSLAFFTLLNGIVFKSVLGLQSPNAAPVSSLPNEVIHQNDSLKQVIGTLQARIPEIPQQKAPVAHDVTHYIYKERVPRIEIVASVADSTYSYRIYLGQNDVVPASLRERLAGDGLLVSSGGEAWAIVPSGNRQSIGTRSPSDLQHSLDVAMMKPAEPRFVFLDEKTQPTIKASATGLTMATQRALDKHYHRGIGIELAPHLDMLRSFFSHGEGNLAPRIGLTADWIVSPSFSLESGIDYFKASVQLDEDSRSFVPPHDNLKFGAPLSINITNTLGSVPLALKYRQWISSRNQAVLRLGATPMFTLSKQYQFRYQFADYGTGPDHDIMQVNTVDQRNEFKYFGTMLTGSVGITSTRLKGKGKFETSLFYERSLKGVANERQSLQIAGIRAAYWLRVR